MAATCNSLRSRTAFNCTCSRQQATQMPQAAASCPGIEAAALQLQVALGILRVQVTSPSRATSLGETMQLQLVPAAAAHYMPQAFQAAKCQQGKAAGALHGRDLRRSGHFLGMGSLQGTVRALTHCTWPFHINFTTTATGGLPLTLWVAIQHNVRRLVWQ